ncbi:MAG: extracellular solute-binding protein [Desulfovibrionaceae bacterium]
MKHALAHCVRACVLCLALVGAAHAENVVSVFNWTEYMPDAVLEKFTAETGIKVVYSTFESNEALYTKLKLTGGKGYDVVIPSTYYVSRMRKEGMLAPLDRDQLSHFGNLVGNLLNKPYDPQNVYSVPYLWGGTGLGVNPRRTEPAAITSWADLWRPEFKGMVLLQDDLREVFGIGLQRLGYSINDTDPEHIKQAYELLKTLLPSVRTFNSDNPKIPYINNEVSLGMLWNGEAYQAQKDGEQIAFVWPKEGGIMWMDCMVIPKNAENKANAHAFINFILRPDIAEEISLYVGYNTPNAKAMTNLPEAFRANPVVFPPWRIMDISEFQDDVGDVIKVYEHYWTLLKTGF